MTFRAKLFVAAFLAAAIALAIAGLLVADASRRRTDTAIDQTLVAETRLAAELLSRGMPAIGEPGLQEEARRLGALVNARVTLIAADGRVVGDSSETAEGLAAMENHAERPEVVEARRQGLGRARRHSATLNIDMLYLAVPVTHPTVAFVRVALPLTSIRQQFRGNVNALLLALGVALAAGALMAWFVSGRIGHRVELIASVARRYRSGDLTPAALDYGDDELGTVARSLDQSVQELGRRLGELARDRARMEAILSGMIEGVIVVDPQGRLQLVNDAARLILKLDDLKIGHPYVETIRHPVIAQLLAAALAGEMPPALQLSPPRDPSRAIMAHAAQAAVSGAHGAILVLHDITDLRRADQIRRDFVANVSHELRTPLTAIRGYVEALSEDDTAPEDRQRFLEIVKRHTLRMERLVKDLLRLARLDAGQETLDVSTCDTRTLVSAVTGDLGSILEERGQRVDLTLGPGADALRGDPAKLHDVLRNLIANASTYAPAGTIIRIEALHEERHVSLSVTDQGPGIPEEDLSRIFERFYRVEKSRARDPGGTGLGLAIVKHLIGLHGGEVRAENRPEGGASFIVSLPA